jgi:replication factor A1
LRLFSITKEIKLNKRTAKVADTKINRKAASPVFRPMVKRKLMFRFNIRRINIKMSKMNLEEIVDLILSSRSDLKRKEIMEIIDKKKSEAGDFLTDETAARIAASELGVEIVKKPFRLKIQIQDLISGLNDVTVDGQVVAIYPPKTFTRRDWTEGKVASILISDNSGTLRVVLWDDKVELVESGKIKQKQTIKISHGYTREGLDGNPELHLGQRGRIKIIRKAEK